MLTPNYQRIWCAFAGSLICLFLVTHLPAQSAQEQLQHIMSYRFPSGLVASSFSDRVAWVENDQGVQNVFTTDADGQAQQHTHFLHDDGQAISNLIFSPDDQWLYFIRGGGPNRAGEIPNPTSAADQARREIWQLHLPSDSLEMLTEGAQASLSPDGMTLAFVKNGQVWQIDVAAGGEPVQFFQIRGGAGSLRWSPDNRKLAFVSARGDHSFIGVYDRQTSQITYLNPSVDQDSNPVWAPDSRRVAFMRMPHESFSLPFFPRRESLPWSIHVGDVTTGSSEEIWRAKPGPGSTYRFISAPNQLFWGVGDRIVFPWEGDYWTHLYSITVNGDNLQLLTPGPFEVQFASLSPDRQAIIYDSNQDDLDRKHIWQVPVGGGTPELLTPGTGVEWSPVLTGGSQQLYCLAASGTKPAFVATLEETGLAVVRGQTDNYPTDLLTEPEAVMFSAADGIEIHGQLFLPKVRIRGERYPAVIFFHGGSRRQMLLGFHHRGYYHHAYALNQFLASQGYIVLSVNYRSGIGYGMPFREALNYGASGASEFQDALGAGLYLRNRADVDSARIGLWGGSYGGFLTAMGLAKASDLFAAGVDIHGVHDWNVVIKNFRPNYNPNDDPELAALARASSPMSYVKDWRSPVLVIHGDDDRNVPFSETVDLVESLRRHGVYHEQLIFPDEVHGFLLHANWVKAYSATFDFFERMLKE